MNWDAIGAVAELLAAIGVIISFVYLAGQIRQNTRAQRRANLGDISSDLAATFRSAATTPELTGLFLRGLADLDSLDPVERYRFDGFLYTWLASFERAFLDARDGEYPEELLVPMRAGVAGFLRTEGGRSWFDERRAWFSAFGQRSIQAIIDDPDIATRGAGPLPPA